MALDLQNISTLTVKVAGLSEPVKFSDWRWDRLWATISFSDGDSAARDFFIGTPGQQIAGGRRTLTDVDTNTPRSGDNGLPVDWEMFIFSIRTDILRVAGTNNPDLSPLDFDEASLDSDTPNRRMWFELMRKCKLELRINNKPRNDARFLDWPQAGGITLVTNDVAETLANNGVPSPRDGFALVIPIHLRPNVAFKVRCTPVVALALTQAQVVNDDDNTSVEPQCKFEGLIKLPVA
jgi:hypothetical protein